MAILKTHTYENGSMVGYDDALQEWVPLDPQAEQGSFIGNVGRAAGRSVREIGAGVEQLLGAGDEQDRIALQREQEAAYRSAPYAESIGSVIPDIGAGIAGAAGTLGLGLPAILAAEAGLGAISGAIRPGDIEERGARAAVGATFGLVGGLAGPIAGRAAAAATGIGEMITGRTVARVGQQIDLGGARIRTAESAAGTVQQPGAVGAARTPEELIDVETRLETEMLEQTERAGAISTREQGGGFEGSLARAREAGFKGNMGQGTRAGSMARWGQSLKEVNPWYDEMQQASKAGDQQLLVRQAAKAMGDPLADKVERIDLYDIATRRAAIGQEFEAVERGLPDMDARGYANALRSVPGQTKGAFGKTAGQKIVQDAIETATARKGGAFSAAEIMADRRLLSQEMADAFAKGRTADGEVLMNAINKLDDAIERVATREGKKRVVGLWQKARTQWQLQAMISHGASVSKTGDINPATLLNQMKKERSKGGFGPGGPDRDTPEGLLWDLVVAAADAETGIPATGIRAVAQNIARSRVGKITATGALGSAGFYGAGGVFGN